MPRLCALLVLAGVVLTAMRPRPPAPTALTAWGYPISLTVH